MDIQVNGYEATATILTFVAVAFLSIPKRIGYGIATWSQLFWILFAIDKKHYFLLLQAVVLIGINWYGNYSWKKKGIGN